MHDLHLIIRLESEVWCSHVIQKSFPVLHVEQKSTQLLVRWNGFLEPSDYTTSFKSSLPASVQANIAQQILKSRVSTSQQTAIRAVPLNDFKQWLKNKPVQEPKFSLKTRFICLISRSSLSIDFFNLSHFTSYIFKWQCSFLSLYKHFQTPLT